MVRITLFGDSVFAGYGLEPQQGPAARLEALLGKGFSVLNAGIPDETSADGLARSAAIDGDLILIGFGLNDAIEGVSRDTTVANLRRMLAVFEGRGRLAEMLVPRGSHWPACTDQTGIVAEAAGVAPFMPDLLAGLPDDDMVQVDGLHPNPAGAARVAERLADALTAWKVTEAT